MSEHELGEEDAGMRLDQYLSRRHPDYSRSFLKGLIERGLVFVGGKPAAADKRLRAGELVSLRLPQARWAEEDVFERWVLHEDASLLVLAKPAGLLMHPLGETWLSAPEAAAADEDPNLAGVLLKVRPAIARSKTPRCGIVHRLDRQTSGVLLVAKTVKAYKALVQAFQDREIDKTYRAIVRGVPERKATQVEAPIGRKPGHRRVVVTPFGKSAQTDFSVIDSGAGAALVEARPRTGRTHQIRAHLALIGHPVAGDPEFDKPESRPQAPRLMLHAYRIQFAHPSTGRAARFSAPPPADFKAFWKLCA